MRCGNLELNPSWIFHSNLLELKVMKMNWSCLRLKNDRSVWCQFLIILKLVLFSLILLKDPQKIQTQTSLDSRFPTNTNLLAFYYHAIVPIILTCSWVQRSLWGKQTDSQSDDVGIISTYNSLCTRKMRPIRKFSTSATRPFQSSDERVPASTIFSPSQHPKPTSSNTGVDPAAAAATDDDIISPSNKATSWLLSAIIYLYRKWEGEKERNQGKIPPPPPQSLFFERECCPKNMHETAWPKSVRVREHFQKGTFPLSSCTFGFGFPELLSISMRVPRWMFS